MIKEEAKASADGKDIDFSASNGWLESFHKRHNIIFRTLCGESGDVDEVVVDDWVRRLPELIGSYRTEDIFNMDETGSFFRALPIKSLVQKGTECRGGKMAKERLSIALCCSATGEKFRPLVIWKSLKPRCFKGQNINRIGIFWEAIAKAWMTGSIFVKWLIKFNSRMQRQNRTVLLLLDNAPCHMRRSMSNVNHLFLPANVTSQLQPLDQGIIQAFKLQYRSLMLRWLLTRMDECSNAAELTKKINVLDAIRWVCQAWEGVSGETITRCFQRCGLGVECIGDSETNEAVGLDENLL